MRILLVGPTGQTGNHVIDALRRRQPDVAIRTLTPPCGMQALSIEVIPGNDDTGTQSLRSIEHIPGNDDTGTQRFRSIEHIPGNDDTGTQRFRSIEHIPGNDDTGTQRFRSIEHIPGNDDTGTQHRRSADFSGDAAAAPDCGLAVRDIDAVIYCAPASGSTETAFGIGLIDAAAAAGVGRFVYFAGLPAPVVEAHLAEVGAQSGLAWTVLRCSAFAQGAAALDLAECAATVALDDGQAFAADDLVDDKPVGIIAAIVENGGPGAAGAPSAV
jgi:hypothetical protein